MAVRLPEGGFNLGLEAILLPMLLVVHVADLFMIREAQLFIGAAPKIPNLDLILALQSQNRS